MVTLVKPVANIVKVLLVFVLILMWRTATAEAFSIGWQSESPSVTQDIGVVGSPDWLSAGPWFNGPFAPPLPATPSVIPRLLIERADGLVISPLLRASPATLLDILVFDVAPIAGQVQMPGRRFPVASEAGEQEGVGTLGSTSPDRLRITIYPGIPADGDDLDWFRLTFDNGYGPAVSSGALLVTDVQVRESGAQGPSQMPLPASLWLLVSGLSVGCLFQRRWKRVRQDLPD